MVYGRVLNNIKNHVPETTNYLKPCIPIQGDWGGNSIHSTKC